MNLTSEELRRFGTVINGLLEDLPKLTHHKDEKLPLNNQKYTYSYIQYVWFSFSNVKTKGLS